MSRDIPLARAIFVWSFTHDGTVRRVSVFEAGDTLPDLYADSPMEFEDRFRADADGAVSPDWVTLTTAQRIRGAQTIHDAVVRWGCPAIMAAKAFCQIPEFRQHASKAIRKLWRSTPSAPAVTPSAPAQFAMSL